jgi:glucose-1-phosphate cytidylyltransferase
MKVVLFCGGQGMRLRDYSETIPKPMVQIGNRPILWHIMKYYAHFGHNDFILCLGYGAEIIKNYFLNYSECTSNDFVLSHGGRRIKLINRDIDDWNITFADTGISSNIGQRLRTVRKYLHKHEMFLANYADVLTDVPINHQIDRFAKTKMIGSFLCVKPNLSFHFVSTSPNGVVTRVQDAQSTATRINGGYFVFRPEIFDYINEGEELLQEPFQRLIARQQLQAYNYDGFWVPMDTFKDKARLDDLYTKGQSPWMIWNGQTKHTLERPKAAVKLKSTPGHLTRFLHKPSNA